jgi:hypothetical protein
MKHSISENDPKVQSIRRVLCIGDWNASDLRSLVNDFWIVCHIRVLNEDVIPIYEFTRYVNQNVYETCESLFPFFGTLGHGAFDLLIVSSRNGLSDSALAQIVRQTKRENGRSVHSISNSDDNEFSVFWGGGDAA